MAGVIAALSIAAEAISAIASFAFGASGGVVLGDFYFSGFEVPEQIKIGGSQSMTVHKLVGGERVIDMMGDDPADISWSGLMMDGNPQDRAQQLEYMRASGEPLPLQWGPFFYTVVIHSVNCEILYSRVKYDISCTVLRNEATANGFDDPSMTDAISSDLISAVLAAPAIIAPVVVAAQSAVALAGVLVPGSSARAAVAVSLGAASLALTGLAATAGATMALVAPYGIVSGAAALSTAVAAAGTLAAAIQTIPYINRASRNL